MKISGNNRNHGISLTEVLVVIAIVAILAALLLPAVSRTKASARKGHCQSNLKQWGIMWRSYTTEHNGSFSDGSGTGFPRGEWVWALAEYYNERPKLLFCPEATYRRGRGKSHHIVEYRVRSDSPKSAVTSYGGPTTVYDFPADPKIDPVAGSFWLASYGQNNWAYNIKGTSLQGRRAEFHWREMDIAWETSEVPLFADSMWRGGGPDHDIPDKIAPPSSHGRWNSVGHEAQHFAIMRHGYGINVLYFDGSVRKTKTPIDIWKMKWHNDFDTEAWKTMQFPDWMK